MEDVELEKVVNELASIPADPPTKREQCVRCRDKNKGDIDLIIQLVNSVGTFPLILRIYTGKTQGNFFPDLSGNPARRPQTVCWCPFLPKEPLQIKCTVVILQHPGEEKRCLRTAPMLEFALPPTNFLLYRGRRFSSATDEKLKSIFSSPNTILFYPGLEAVGLETLPTVEENCNPYNIIILDGTWSQAKSLYANCHELKNVKQIQINSKVVSEYVIRTQPTEKALSTVETAAVALSTLEKQSYIKEVLLQPLKALCGFQLAHGALMHQSKEFLIKNGLHKSQNKLFLPQKEYLV